MASPHAVDTLLRPPVELWSAAVAAGAGTVAQFAPWALLMPPAMGTITAMALAGFALHRLRQGCRVVRYQRSMKRLPMFVMKAGDVPVSHRKYYLGLGFRWSQVHTQRLRDTRRPEVQHFIDPGYSYRAVRRFENAVEGKPLLAKVAAITGTRAWWNPVAPLPAVGGDPHIHAVSPNEEPVYTDLSERVGHMVVYGATRVGKTRLLEIGATQDIRRGDVVVVIDPKGDGELMKRCYAEAARAAPARYVLSVPSGLSGGQRTLQRHRQLQPDHAGRHAPDQSAAVRRQLRRLPRVLLALRQHHRA
ncbi:MAG TPA: hypothetical protein VLJ62_04780, partial [Burkholderiaceae bacterium]|nr:hypothetical protein [Burkholderiaceae bacterium]